VNIKVEELLRSGVEKDVEAGKELNTKTKALIDQFDKLSTTVGKRIKLAANNLSFQKRVKQVSPSSDYQRNIVSHLPVLRSFSRQVVRLSVTLRYRGHIGWNTSKIISWLISLGCSLSLQTSTSRI